MFRRINLFSGPCGGKSTMAAYLFAELKIRKINVELVEEYCKMLAYQKIPPQSYDELYWMSKQIHKEDVFLRHGAKIVITDSPVLLPYIYTKKTGLKYTELLLKLHYYFNDTYPSLNILLNREGIEYKTEGRYENEQEAKEIDHLIKETLKYHVDYFAEFKSIDREKILDYIISKINSQ